MRDHRLPQSPASSRVLTRRSFVAALGLGLGGSLLSGCGGGEKDVAATAPGEKGVVYDRQDPSAAAGGATGSAAQPGTAASELTLYAVGDVLLHQNVYGSGMFEDGSRNYDHLFAHVKADIEAADIAVVEQETILGGEAFEFQGFPTFNGPQEVIDAEVAAGFDVAIHANNHAMDQGLAGIEAELSYWREHYPQVTVTGIYDNEADYERVGIVEKNGRRVAILSYTATTNGIALPDGAPWAVRMLSESRIEQDMALAREAGADVIVAFPHCGTEYAEEADSVQRYWAGLLADQGADAVICDHPHVIQPFEWLDASDGRRVPCFWSTGNFVSGQLRKDTMVEGMAKLSFAFGDGSAQVKACSMEILVDHKAEGTNFSVYPLRDYTEELASQNLIRYCEGCSDFSRQWCVDFAAGRMGSGFNAETCEFVADCG